MLLKIREGEEYTLTKHALTRLEKRKITLEDLIDALTKPKKVIKMIAGPSDDRASIIGNNDLFVVFNINTLVIITVYKYSRQYQDSLNKNKRNKKERYFRQQYGNRMKTNKRQVDK